MSKVLTLTCCEDDEDLAEFLTCGPNPQGIVLVLEVEGHTVCLKQSEVDRLLSFIQTGEVQ